MKKFYLKVLPFLVLLPFLIGGCALGTLQTAETTPKGHVDLYAGFTSFPEIGGKLPEMGFKIGLSDKLDAGLRLFGMGFLAEAKFALFQNRDAGPSLSLIGGIGYSDIGDDITFTIYDLGAIFSLKLGVIEPYVSIKYREFYPGDALVGDNDFADKLNGEFVFNSIGVLLFPKSPVSVFAEATYLQSIKLFDTSASGTSSAIINIGLRLRI